MTHLNVDGLAKRSARRPAVIVHCKHPWPLSIRFRVANPTGAAKRFPDQCSQDPEGARRVNVESSRSLARAARTRNILFVYISTDYIFSGKPGEAPYAADAVAEPTNIYGQTKLDGERAVLEETRGTGLGVVLRVPVLYGEAEQLKESAINELMDKVWDAQKENAKVNMDDWARRYPTNTEDVARVCQSIAIRYLLEDASARAKLPTVLQFTSEDRFTKYEICQIMGEIMGLPIGNITPSKEGNDPAAAVQRPFDCHLSTEGLKSLGIPIWTQDFRAWW